jgi:hypothetical protein
LSFTVASFQRKADKGIVIELTPNSASDTQYPKAFDVTLFNITAGASVDEEYLKTMVIISSTARTTQFLKLRSDSLKTPLSNGDMTKYVFVGLWLLSNRWFYHYTAHDTVIGVTKLFTICIALVFVWYKMSVTKTLIQYRVCSSVGSDDSKPAAD